MKFLKILFVLILVLLLSGIAVAITGWLMLRGTPAWYRVDAATFAQQQTAASNVEEKLIHIHNWLAGSRARRVAAAPSTQSPATSVTAAIAGHDPDQPFQIQFTDDELNAFFHKWTDSPDQPGESGASDENSAETARKMRLMGAANQYIASPRLVFHDNKLILAALVKDFGMVVSLEFEPRINAQGNLEMNLQRVLGGILPLPDGLIGKRREQLERVLRRKLLNYQRSAQIYPDGSVNSAATAAGMNELLLAALNHEPADAVLYAPYNGSINHSMPLKLTAVSIQGNLLSMTVQEMNPAERVALLARITSASGAIGSLTP